MCAMQRDKKETKGKGGGKKEGWQIIAVFLFPAVVFCSSVYYNLLSLRKVVAHTNTVRAYHNIISPFICMRCH